MVASLLELLIASCRDLIRINISFDVVRLFLNKKYVHLKLKTILQHITEHEAIIISLAYSRQRRPAQLKAARTRVQCVQCAQCTAYTVRSVKCRTRFTRTNTRVIHVLYNARSENEIRIRPAHTSSSMLAYDVIRRNQC